MNLKEYLMKYLGSKRRIAKEILPIMLADRKEYQFFVEPFCGGCNSLDKVSNPRIGSDINHYLIALLKELQTQIPFNPPKIDRTEYEEIRKNKDKYPEWLVGFVGFGLSFSGYFFGSYAKGIPPRNPEEASVRNLSKQQPFLKGILFFSSDYKDLSIPDGSIVYCDPPYRGQESVYKNIKERMNYDIFYEWLKKIAKKNTVFVSEYNMPSFAECVWEGNLFKKPNGKLAKALTTEKLFKIKG
jgi:DNA adenine methylase